jgi:multiple sugar transport system substrate-binding protein
MRNRSVAIPLALALTAILVVASCGSSGSLPEEGVLRVWITWGDDPAQIQDLFDRYSREDGLPVRVTTGLDSDKVVRALSGAASPDVVILSGSDLLRSYDDQGLVEPLDGWIEATGVDLDDIYPAPLAQCQMQDGTTVCLPWGCDLYALFWNKDLFAAAGLDPERPPGTMGELVEYADRLTHRDEKGELVRIGFAPDFSRSHIGLYARMFGGSWYNDDGTAVTLSSQAMLDAATWQLQFYRRYGAEDVARLVSSIDRYTTSRHPLYAGRRLSCQQCHRNTPRKKSPDQGFYAGKVAMMVAGQWGVGPNGVPRIQPDPNYGVAPFPPPADHPERANTAVIEGAVAIIPAGAKNKEAGAELLAWMMSPEILAEAALINANLPTSRAAAQDPRFQQIPNFKVFTDLMVHPNATYIATTPISMELNEALREIEEELLHKEADPARLLHEAQADFAPKLQEALTQRDTP